MESKRRHRFSKQIRKDLSDIFQRDPRHYFGDNLTTITDVTVAVDLSLARVYFSVFPTSAAEDVVERLNRQKGEIRGKLGNLIGKQVRKIPELAFFHDDTQEQASNMDQLIDSLDIPPAPDEDGDQ